ncbi:AraC family transcriptional regulator [Conexibacter sp. SYSU D00693]|uniref:AraC family transcriptional regulator n=1 Tax=Conexibacter sp. SYSU D00693 TaxID=2812560 RepID=UPI00196B972F|nr:AraC family transcriptional regulator [Conexibacter sp. SYSU D00693]
MQTPDRLPLADPLGEALHALHMDGAFYCRSELTAPWGMELMAMDGYLWFHVVTAGRARLEAPGGEPVELGPGDLALVPHGHGHVLRSDPGAPAPGILSLDRTLLTPRYELLRHGGDGAPTTMVCAAVRFDHPAARSLVALLPPTLVVPAARGLDNALTDGTVRLIAAEARNLRPGGEAVITRLADVLVIQAIRAWLEDDPSARRGWLGALRDPQVGAALALIHRDAARDWTVAALAREVAMSRSAFAARFTDLVGEPAMQYVTRWRMQVATEALRAGETTVGELAARLGYRSEAAFARAFKRVVGTPPGAVRRQALQLPA